jgi:hypothetical protein
MTKKQELTAQKEQLQAQMDAICKELESLPKEWEYPKDGTQYYCINSNNFIFDDYWSDTDCDRFRFDSGNFFLSEDSAKEQQRINNLLIDFKKKVWELQEDWKPDFSDNNAKSFIYIWDNDFIVSFNNKQNHYNFYFQTSDIAFSIIETFPAEDLKLILKNVKSNG